jgi:hypothetical protein
MYSQAILDCGIALVLYLRQQGLNAYLFGGVACQLRAGGLVQSWPWLPARRDDVDIVVCRGSNVRTFAAMRDVAEPCQCDSDARSSADLGRFDILRDATRIHCDVYWAQALRFNHVIRLDRCDGSDVTLAGAELLLSKLQIHVKKDTDWADLMVLFASHGLGTKGAGEIELDVIRRHCSRGAAGWGMAKICLESLTQLAIRVAEHCHLQETDRAVILGRIAQLEGEIRKTPKPWRWRLRATIGTRLNWYSEAGYPGASGRD